MQYVMVLLKGSVPVAFGGTEQPAAYGELVSIGGLNPATNKKLSAAIASILESKLSIPKSRFYLNFSEVQARHLCYLIHLVEYGPLSCTLLLIMIPVCLGSSKSRIRTMFTCFTPTLAHVIASSLSKSLA